MAIIHDRETKTRTRTAPPRAPLPPSVIAPRHRRPERRRKGVWGAAAGLAALAVATLFGTRAIQNGEQALPDPDGKTATPTPEARKSHGEPALALPVNEENSLYRQIVGNDNKAQVVADVLGTSMAQVQTSGESQYFEAKGDSGDTWAAVWTAPDGTKLTLFAYAAEDMDVKTRASIPGSMGDPGRAELVEVNQQLAAQGVAPIKAGPMYTPFEVPGSDGGFHDDIDSFVFYGEEGGYVLQGTILDNEGRALEDGGQRLTLLFEQLAAVSQQ